VTSIKSDGAARLRGAQERSSRRSAFRAIAFLVLAVVAAIAAAVILSDRFDERLADIKDSQVVTMSVVVADVDLPLGTTLDADLIKAVDWPEESTPEGHFEVVEDLFDRVVVTKIYKGEPILVPKLADAGAGAGLSAILPPGMLAVAVRVDDVVGVAGFIHPGDSVDIIVTMKPEGQTNTQTTSKIILQNVRVLTVGKQLNRNEQKRAKPMPTTVATLMVTPDEAEALALAAAKGKILLALRSALSEEFVATEGMNATGLMPQLAHRRPALGRRRKIAQPVATPAPVPAPGDVVEILRGDRFEQRRFEEKKESE